MPLLLEDPLRALPLPGRRLSGDLAIGLINRTRFQYLSLPIIFVSTGTARPMLPLTLHGRAETVRRAAAKLCS